MKQEKMEIDQRYNDISNQTYNYDQTRETNLDRLVRLERTFAHILWNPSTPLQSQNWTKTTAYIISASLNVFIEKQRYFEVKYYGQVVCQLLALDEKINYPVPSDQQKWYLSPGPWFDYCQALADNLTLYFDLQRKKEQIEEVEKLFNKASVGLYGYMFTPPPASQGREVGDLITWLT